MQELVHEKGLELLGFGCLSNPDNEMVRTAMAGALMQAAAMKVPVMLDGVAVCKAAKKAADMAPAVLDYCFAGHVSAEPGAEECLQELGLTAPLRLNIPDAPVRALLSALRCSMPASRPTKKWKPLRKQACMRR